MAGPAQEGAEVQQFSFKRRKEKKKKHLLALPRVQHIQKIEIMTVASLQAIMEKETEKQNKTKVRNKQAGKKEKEKKNCESSSTLPKSPNQYVLA